jgi:hypothetical protein
MGLLLGQMLGCDQQQNLGQRARGKAVRSGVLMGGLALGLALLTNELGASKTLGWLVALPAALSAYLLLSGSLGICVYHGIKGHRGADYGTEAVLDPERRSELRLRALLVVSVSLLVACGFAAAIATSG